jgi:hypothetical protein
MDKVIKLPLPYDPREAGRANYRYYQYRSNFMMRHTCRHHIFRGAVALRLHRDRMWTSSADAGVHKC